MQQPLPLVYAPHPIYRQLCAAVETVDETVRQQLEAMMATLRAHEAIGLGAPMVGITRRLVVIEMVDEAGQAHSYRMVNPVVVAQSDAYRTMEEASISFVGISAPVTRPASVTVAYLDEQGVSQTLQAHGLLAACVQHEIDYLNGMTILDHQPPMKRNILLRKLRKHARASGGSS